MYLLLGCGTTGYFTASRLQDLEKDVVIVEKNPERVASLRERGLEVVEGNMTNKEILEKAGISRASAVLIMANDLELNKKAVRLVKKLRKDAVLIVRAGPKSTKNEFKDEADVVIYPTNVLADYTIQSLEAMEFKKKFKRLKEIIASADKGLAIVTQDNPDPDAIASALALKRIAEGQGKKADIIYGEEIGYDENRALVNLMGIEMIHRSKVKDLRGYSKIALIEASIPGENNSLDKGIVPDIIIDHHPANMKKVKADFRDIRPEVGATSTIMTEYLTYLDRELDEELATVLLYGIKTDTKDFTRGATPEDLRAVIELYPKANHDLLARIGTPPMSSESLDILGKAIKNRRIEGSYLISNVGFIRERDTLPQAADYLLSLEGISTVLVYGVGKNVVHISGRNRDIRLNLGDAMTKAFGDIGEAGGHAQAAAAKVPLGLFGEVKDKDSLLSLAEEAIVDKFFKVVGIEKKT
ncbi:MAG: DHH family phosphoesterase [Candidatus Hydrothermarchaeales archaeon]